MSLVWMIASALLLGVCMWSAAQYWRRAQRLAALLVVLLGMGVGALLQWEMLETWLQSRFHFAVTSSSATVHWDSDRQKQLSVTMSKQVERASTIVMRGDGLRASQWRDLPARRLQWQAPEGRVRRERLDLQAPLSVNLGREYTMQIARPNFVSVLKSAESKDTSSTTKRKPWSAQLLAENGSILAESSSNSERLQLHWLPALAERLELQLKVFDETGRLIDSGPVPLEVLPHRSLQVTTRFEAPSFDISSLRQLLQMSDANLDSQTRLGQNVQQLLQEREKRESIDLLMIDAAYWENAKPRQRQEILDLVSAGSSLMILGSNARQPAIWRESFGLDLRQNSNPNRTGNAQELSFELALTSQRMEISNLVMTATALQAQSNQHWSPLQLALQRGASSSAILARTWQRGRIVWLGLSDWHRYTISAPESLKQWWQVVLDQSLPKSGESGAIEIKEPMPIVGERTMLCLDAIGTYTQLQVARETAIPLHASAEFPGQGCVAWRPLQAGWQVLQAKEQKPMAASQAQSQLDVGLQKWVYVYPEAAWPTWQREIKRQASLAYQERIPAEAPPLPTPIPRWPLVVCLLVLSLALWRTDAMKW